MKRLIWAVVMWVGMSAAALALTIEERLVAGLQGQGYVILEQGYTFLGRLRIVAQNDQIRREMVVNPGTGEVLRDYAILLSDLLPKVPVAEAQHSGSTTTASGPGTSVAVVDEPGVVSTAVLGETLAPELPGEWVIEQPLPMIQGNP